MVYIYLFIPIIFYFLYKRDQNKTNLELKNKLDSMALPDIIKTYFTLKADTYKLVLNGEYWKESESNLIYQIFFEKALEFSREYDYWIEDKTYYQIDNVFPDESEPTRKEAKKFYMYIDLTKLNRTTLSIATKLDSLSAILTNNMDFKNSSIHFIEENNEIIEPNLKITIDNLSNNISMLTNAAALSEQKLDDIYYQANEIYTTLNKNNLIIDSTNFLATILSIISFFVK